METVESNPLVQQAAHDDQVEFIARDFADHVILSENDNLEPATNMADKPEGDFQQGEMLTPDAPTHAVADVTVAPEKIAVKTLACTVKAEAPVTPSTAPVADASMDVMFAKCKELALSKEFHSALIRDKMFCPFLVLCLASDSESEVLRSLEVFHLLVIHPENIHGLSKIEYFFDGLKAAAGNGKIRKEIRDFAHLVLEMMKKSQKQIPLKSHCGNKQAHHQHSEQPTPAKKSGSASCAKSANKSISKGKPVDFYVPVCIFKEKRLKITEALLTLNGILSITYDLKKCYCLIRAKSHIPSEVLGKTIANLGYDCHLVSKGENDEIVMMAMTPDPKLENSSSMYDKENLNGRKSPQYLSDSDPDESFKEPQAVAKPEASEKEKKGWLSSATNFLQKSFYW